MWQVPLPMGGFPQFGLNLAAEACYAVDDLGPVVAKSLFRSGSPGTAGFQPAFIVQAGWKPAVPGLSLLFGTSHTNGNGRHFCRPFQHFVLHALQRFGERSLETAAQSTEVVDSEGTDKVNCGWSAEPYSESFGYVHG